MLELRHWAGDAVRMIGADCQRSADVRWIPPIFALVSLIAAVAAVAPKGLALATGVLQHGF